MFKRTIRPATQLVSQRMASIAPQARAFSRAVGRRRDSGEGYLARPRRNDFLDEFFNDPFFRPLLSNMPRRAAPELDMNVHVSETPQQFLVRAELPGVKKEDVKVTFHDHVLSISAERKEEQCKDDEQIHYSEVTFGRLERALRVPDTADRDKIDAQMEDGVLTISIGKSEHAKETTIQIK